MFNCTIKRVLVLGAHTDDAELGCGGTIARLVAEGIEVFVGVFSICEQSLPLGSPPDTLMKECFDAMSVLGVKVSNVTIQKYPVRNFPTHRQEILENILLLRNSLKPNLVFLPCEQDMHQDHQVIHAEGIRAFKGHNALAFELPWNNQSFKTQVQISISERDLTTKQTALDCYRSQAIKQRPYFDHNYLRAWATFRGVSSPTRLAEAFEVLNLSL